MSLKTPKTAQAINDVIDIAEQIAAWSSLNASDRFLEAIKRTYQQIADMPGIGVERDYGQPNLKGMRMWRVVKHPQYLVFYLPAGSELVILRVLHGSQNIDAIFRASG